MAELLRARRMVQRIPFATWRDRMGSSSAAPARHAADTQVRTAWNLARHVDRAAWRMAGEWLCLPRALALITMLRRRGIPYALHIAARPAAHRTGTDDLHAWVDVGPARVIGDLPGEWAVIFRATG